MCDKLWDWPGRNGREWDRFCKSVAKIERPSIHAFDPPESPSCSSDQVTYPCCHFNKAAQAYSKYDTSASATIYPRVKLRFELRFGNEITKGRLGVLILQVIRVKKPALSLRKLFLADGFDNLVDPLERNTVFARQVAMVGAVEFIENLLVALG